MAVGGPRVLGLVLAGGRSSRWGSEKAVAEMDGAPMVARVAAVLARGCEAVAVNAPETSGAAAWAREHGLRLLPDPPGQPDGPLAGVLAGLTAAEAEGWDGLVTGPCDTPWLPADMVSRLTLEGGGRPAATAVTEEGSHPLCTFWRTALRPRLADDLAGGDHPSVRAWLRDQGAAQVRFAEPRAFANLNAPPPPRPSPARIVLTGLAGLAAAAAGGLGARIALELWAARFLPDAVGGGDASPLFLPALFAPLLAAGLAGAGAVALGLRARRGR